MKTSIGVPLQYLHKSWLIVIFLVFSFLKPSLAWSTQVDIAGFAFDGDFKSAAERFPYTFKIFQEQKATKDPSQSFSYLVINRSKDIVNSELTFLPGSMINLKDGDRALMAVLMMTGETVSIESFGSYNKIFVNLRADAMIFDYKSQTIVRSCPTSVVLFDASNTTPSESRILGFVNELIRRDDSRGLISQFNKCMSRLTLPKEGGLTVQVRKGEVDSEALAMMPATLKNDPNTVNAMLADALGSILSSKLGISMLPTSIGHAVGGVMTMRLENGDDYKIKLGEGDYLFDVKLNKLKKIKIAENNVSASYVYGAYASLKFYEPGTNQIIIDSDIKNGESSIVPIDKVDGSDFPAYQDAIRGIFVKFVDALNNPGSKWIITAASAKDIESQITSARSTLIKCK